MGGEQLGQGRTLVQGGAARDVGSGGCGGDCFSVDGRKGETERI